ncbi:MAG TPA: glycosyltransferase family 87 protein [Candidatus Dormibacteraeota bacterium]|nr:glycosyltransferase family 87 protein [Candidatus Dormibacteraeota bacterium]
MRYLQGVRWTRRVLIGIAVLVVLAALAVDIVHRQDRTGIDFHTYLAAARVGLHQGWAQIYDQQIVAQEQKQLVPYLWSQPFLSPPTVAWLVAPFSGLPYDSAYNVWALFTFALFACALAWAAAGQGWSRWIAVAGALSPWWVMHSVNVGQVVPLVAASTVVAWRLLRERHDVAAGLVLSAVLLKPNTAVLVPLALLVAGRPRAFAAWFGAAACIALAAAAMLGPHGTSAYLAQLRGPLPTGADGLTLHGAFGIAGWSVTLIRLGIVAAVLASAYKLRGAAGLVIPVAILGSLLVAPYLHASDLCLLSAAGWMVWQERPAAAWRVALASLWVLANPYLFIGGVAPTLIRWPVFELGLLAAIVLAAWQPLTARADLRSRAPA